MHCTTKIYADTYFVGASDRRLELFENAFPIPRGVSYNSYIVLDEKTILLDTVDKSVSTIFFENLAYLLEDRKLDYLVVNHMEPDHCATMAELVLRYPEVTIVTNEAAATMIRQFFDFDLDSRLQLIKEGDTLSTGAHEFTFVMAPMVHWPEAMVTYDITFEALYSADAFGTFGALNGNIFADQLDFEHEWLSDARRYYTNIVGKYGTQVQAVLKKALGLKISFICPLHGPIWRSNISWYINKYISWAIYEPEEQGVLIAYGSIYGNTENAASILANRLAENGVKNITIFDVSKTHPSYILSEAFRFSHLIFASATYNAGIFVNMETLLHDIKAHNLQNRKIALVENGSWAPAASELMKNLLSDLENITWIDSAIQISSSVKEVNQKDLLALADEISKDFHREFPTDLAADMDVLDPKALFKLSYGLFVITTKEGIKDNGCIINTAMQITDKPFQIIVGINKANYTHDMVLKSKKFNLSVLGEDAPFKVFQTFGFQSGRDVDKFADCVEEKRSANGILYLPQYTNSVISAEVVATQDVGTHTVFTALVTEAEITSPEKSMTYEYYFSNVKPAPPKLEEKHGWLCTVCGYIHESDEIADDYVCPLCKHGVSDFVRI